MAKVQSLALQMMEKTKSVKERAVSYFDSIKRNLQRSIIDNLTAKEEKLQDKIFELGNFSMQSDQNAGITRECCERRFSELIQTEYDLELVQLELKAKQEAFDKYFN